MKKLQYTPQKIVKKGNRGNMEQYYEVSVIVCSYNPSIDHSLRSMDGGRYGRGA